MDGDNGGDRMTEHAHTCDDYEPDPLIAVAEPVWDQCGQPGHGWVYVSVQADVCDPVMKVAADCDYLTAGVQLTLEQATALADSLVQAKRAILRGRPKP